jgi:hypothetical protein
VEDEAIELFEWMMRDDSISIDYNVAGEPQSLSEYIETCRMKLWDHAYNTIFKGADAFKKSDSFKDFKGSIQVVRRLLYRYANYISSILT